MANYNDMLSGLKKSRMKVRVFRPSDTSIIAQWHDPSLHGESPVDFTSPEIICALVATDENDVPICMMAAREAVEMPGRAVRQKNRWIRLGPFSFFFLAMQVVKDSLRGYMSRTGRHAGAKL